jgi:DNA-binding transcriptional MerR regulator
MPSAARPFPDDSGEPGPTWSISDLTAEFNVTARALRFYEDEGLLSPDRQGLARIYRKRDRARLVWILRARNVGFSLAEIRELIDLYDLDDGRTAQRRVSIERCREKVAKLKRHRDDIEAAITELADFISHLESLELPPGEAAAPTGD